MGSIVVDALITALQTVTNGILIALAAMMTSISQTAITLTTQPWVTTATQVTVAVASGVFTVRLAYEAVTRYILWNEGTADHDGGQIWKGILRVGIYGAGSTYLATQVFQIGIWMSGALLAQPIGTIIAPTQNIFTAIFNTPGLVHDIILVAVVGVLVLVVCAVIISIQMAIRAAELIFYIVAGPIAALGQFSGDGGMWNAWWRGLLVLGMAQAVQMLGLRIVIACFAIPNLVGANGLPPQMPGLLLAVGAAVATVRGPHIVKEWAYHSGVGGGGMFIATTFIRGRMFGGPRGGA